MSKIKIVALLGKSGAGKDTVQNILLKYYPDVFHRIVSCTTRPKRDYEVEGVDYHYITRDEFKESMLADHFIEALEFNGWFYGSRLEELNPDKINIGIYTPSGIECLRQTADDYNLEILPIYVRCADITRIFRQLSREQCPDVKEIMRRYKTDEADFMDINFPYYIIYNEADTIDEADIVETIGNYCKDFFD